MNLVTLDRIDKQYSERPLLESASLLINLGDRIGLIGVNGSGKTTLLKIIAGSEPPDKGAVTVTGGVRIEYLAQEPPLDDDATVIETIFRSQSPQMRLLREYEAAAVALQRHPDAAASQQRMFELSAEMDRTDGWSAETNAKTVLTQLGIIDFDARVGALSGGQRKRVALARALIDRADLLILDEPTNHIDAATVAWLEEYLATAPGALLMVTHDRYFLDRVANRIVEIDRRELVSYPGNYTHYVEQHAERHERLAEDETKRQNLLRRELEWLRRQPMARGTKQKARKQRVEELMQLRYDSGNDRVAIALAGRRLGKRALDAQGLVKRYDQRTVLNSLDLHLEPGDRIGIVGPNGAGKSTLLDVLASRLTPDHGTVEWGDTVQIGYYDQRSIDLRDSQRLIEFIENEAAVVRTKEGERVEAAQMLEWFLFPRPLQYGRIGSLSGGERRRLYLLRTLVHQPNVLLLDEPTNDLDIQTLAVLEEFLDHFTGCLVVASHDRYFLDRTVDFLVTLENGQLGPRYPGPFSTFLRLQEEAQAPVRAATDAPQPKTVRQRSEQRKLTWKEQQELNELEVRIESLEARRFSLLDEIQKSGDNYVGLRVLSDELNKIEQEVDAAMARWLELSSLTEPTGK